MLMEEAAPTQLDQLVPCSSQTITNVVDMDLGTLAQQPVIVTQVMLDLTANTAVMMPQLAVVMVCVLVRELASVRETM